MCGEAARILNAREATEPQPINKISTAAFCGFKIFDTSSEGDCNSEFTRAQQVSDACHWEGFRPGSDVALLCSE